MVTETAAGFPRFYSRFLRQDSRHISHGHTAARLQLAAGFITHSVTETAAGFP